MSLYQMSPNDIVKSDNFVESVSNPIIEQIKNNSNNCIILAGTRGSGKSIILNAYKEKMKNSNELAVSMYLDPAIHNDYLTDNEASFRYELFLASHLINFIRKNHLQIYEDYFSSIQMKLIITNQHFMNYINNRCFLGNNDEYPNLISKGLLIQEIIQKIKQTTGINTLTICLDRFDWVNSSSSKFQEIAKFYISLFDKTILTTDDKELYLDENQKRTNLTKKGYHVINIDYGKKIDIAKQIVTADLKYYAKTKHTINKKFINRQFVDLRNLIDETIYTQIIKNCNGDLSLLFDSIRPLYDYSDIDSENNNKNIVEYYEYAINKKLKRNELIKTLHL